MPDKKELERLVSAITVDADTRSEQATAFYEVFVSEVTFPTEATVVGAAVDVTDIDLADDGEHLIACCRRGGDAQDLRFADLVFGPGTTAGWIHAAYRSWLGEKTRPSAMPTGWQPSWL